MLTTHRVAQQHQQLRRPTCGCGSRHANTHKQTRWHACKQTGWTPSAAVVRCMFRANKQGLHLFMATTRRVVQRRHAVFVHSRHICSLIKQPLCSGHCLSSHCTLHFECERAKAAPLCAHYTPRSATESCHLRPQPPHLLRDPAATARQPLRRGRPPSEVLWCRRCLVQKARRRSLLDAASHPRPLAPQSGAAFLQPAGEETAVSERADCATTCQWSAVAPSRSGCHSDREPLESTGRFIACTSPCPAKRCSVTRACRQSDSGERTCQLCDPMPVECCRSVGVLLRQQSARVYWTLHRMYAYLPREMV